MENFFEKTTEAVLHPGGSNEGKKLAADMIKIFDVDFYENTFAVLPSKEEFKKFIDQIGRTGGLTSDTQSSL